MHTDDYYIYRKVCLYCRYLRFNCGYAECEMLHTVIPAPYETCEYFDIDTRYLPPKRGDDNV